MLGCCFLHSLCRGQAVIALSPGGAEYYGLVTGAAEGLGDISTAKDVGVKLKLRLWLDATVAISIGYRRGLGKLKHMHTVFSWCQGKLRHKEFTICKKTHTLRII